MMPDILDLAMLPALALLAGVTSVEDLREGRIRNKWVLMALMWGAGAYALLSLSRIYAPYLTAPAVANTLFNGSWAALIGMTAANAFCSLLIGFLLFHFGYWAAGDAKLFFAVALLLPLKYYFAHFLPVFPALNLFINTILIAALYVWGETAWKLTGYVRANPEVDIMREIRDSSVVRLKGALRLLLVPVGLFSAIMCAVYLFDIDRRVSVSAMLTAMLAMFLAKNLLKRAIENRAFVLLFRAFTVITAAVLLSSPMRGQFLKMALFMSAFFVGIILLSEVVPGLSEKYKLQKENMPFALCLSLGLVSTVLLKGSFLYLVMYYGNGQ